MTKNKNVQQLQYVTHYIKLRITNNFVKMNKLNFRFLFFKHHFDTKGILIGAVSGILLDLSFLSG